MLELLTEPQAWIALATQHGPPAASRYSSGPPRSR